MQPYLFPYIGYFQLIANTDKWVFFDVVQYNKKSWMNRNRVLHFENNKDYQYISVPVQKHIPGTPIKKILVNSEIDWQQKIFGQLTVYKKMRAEYYDKIIALLSSIFAKKPSSLSELSILSIKRICEYIGININSELASCIEFDRSIIEEPGDWALSISKALGGTVYINPPGGVEIFDEEKYKKNGIDLLFLKPHLYPYLQSNRPRFIPGLSIIDLLMFNEPSMIKKMLIHDCSFFPKSKLEV